MKKHLSTIILILILFTGLSLVLYPTLSDYWNLYHQSRIIADYTDTVEQTDAEKNEEIWKKAQKYNQKLARDGNCWRMTKKQKKEYESLLNVGGTGIMGYIEIPKINCELPVCHGSDPAVLQTAIGHLEGSSLPVGGSSTHCVLSGHRGLPSAKLFTDLDQMENGDVFLLRILDRTLAYQVDQILTVLPEEMDYLKIEEGKDLCTLVTCTPYGVNSHRLLVRGHRIEYTEVQEQLNPETPKTLWEKIQDIADRIKRKSVEWLIILVDYISAHAKEAKAAAAGILLLTAAIILRWKRKKKRKEIEENKEQNLRSEKK